MKTHDTATLDWIELLQVPEAIAPKPGALNIGLKLRRVLNESIKASPLSRQEIAERMSSMLGHQVTASQINHWTAGSREGWRFPLEYLPALETVLETHHILTWLADLRGARLSFGREVLEAQLGKLEHMKGELKRREAAIKKALGERA